jgi:ribosomal protein L17
MLMLRNLVSSLFKHEQISTTLPKAKAASKLADQLISLGKKGKSKSNWERANAFLLQHDDTLKSLFTTFKDRYSDRPGGYTRILRHGYRIGDNAPLAILELVDNKNDLRFENSSKTVARELAIRNRQQGLGPEGFKQWREKIERDGPEGILNNLISSNDDNNSLGEITKKNVSKALQFRLNESKLPVSVSSTTKPLSSLPSATSTNSTSDSDVTPVKLIHPSTLFLDRVYHHYLSSLAQFSLASSSSTSTSPSSPSLLYQPDPSRQISQLTQRLVPKDSKSLPKPVLTVPMIGKKFFAGERTDGYLQEVESSSTGMGPISRAKGDWSKTKLDRKRRVVPHHATEEMDRLEKEFEERL